MLISLHGFEIEGNLYVPNPLMSADCGNGAKYWIRRSVYRIAFTSMLVDRMLGPDASRHETEVMMNQAHALFQIDVLNSLPV